MTPPKAPPEKRPDRHYDFGRMNLWFAVSALALLATTLWMVFADYAQPWKRFQAEFRSLERQKLLQDARDERKKITQDQVTQLRAEIEQAEKAVAGERSGIAALDDQIKELDTRIYSADVDWKTTKSLLDARAFELDTALQHGDGDAAAKQKEVNDLREELVRRKAAKEELEAQRARLAAKRAGKRASVTAAQEKLAALESGLESVETRVAGLDKDVDYLLLNAPLLDFVQPSLKVEQAILPGLYHNINFTEISRVDRCVTCHVAANRPGFEDKIKVPSAGDETGDKFEERQVPQPFRTHPRLDLFVGDGSPHPYTRFGCTSCHGGLDRATDFARAGHSPRDEEQRTKWEEKYGWEPQPYLETPILPAGMTEGGCVNCHASGVWTPSSNLQDTGRELIVHMGCNACHIINYPAYTETRKPGPALTRIAEKTNQGWAYKWIESPRSIHPTTFMPHFFFQENIKTEADKKRQVAEIVGIVSYLWDRSEKRGQYPPAPAGDPARGKQLLETVGCAGCHIVDAKAKRDDFFPVVNRLHGPNLIRTGSKVPSGWLYAWLKNPKQYFPDTSMPNLRLTDGEAADLTAFLMASRDGQLENLGLPAVDRNLRDGLVREYLQSTLTVARSEERLKGMLEADRNVYLGEQTILKYGCYSCHDIKGFEATKPIGTELTAQGSKPVHQLDFGHVHLPHTRADWTRTKILRPRIFDEGKEEVKSYNELLKMPGFGMSEREAQAVLANVLGFTKESVIATRKAGNGSAGSLAEGRKLITRFNCQGCHLIEGHGHAIKDLIKDPTFLPPNLAAEGARVQSDWLFEYLHDPSRVTMRPWLTVRMPTFGFTDEQANTLIGYFNAREQRTPFTSPFPGADAKSAAVGRAVFEIYQCAKCHPSGAEAAQAAGAGDLALAPSLLLAPERLRWNWVADWIKDPMKWVPGTRMPTNFSPAPGQYKSDVPLFLAAPNFAGYRAAIAQHFASEQEMNDYVGDVDKVTAALRDHIWLLSGNGRPVPAPAVPAPIVSGRGPVAAGGAGRR